MNALIAMEIKTVDTLLKGLFQGRKQGERHVMVTGVPGYRNKDRGHRSADSV